MRVSPFGLLLLPWALWAAGEPACPPKCPDFPALSGAMLLEPVRYPAPEWWFTLGRARLAWGTGLSVQLPLEWRPAVPPSLPSASNNYRLQPDIGRGGGLWRLRPQVDFLGATVDTRLRLYGNKFLLRFQNKDESQRLLLTVKSDEARLDYRWRF